MRSTIVMRLIGVVVGAILALPGVGYAQEVVSGTVRDATGGALSGVTVTATHEATGNTFVVVTDAAGVYRIVLRPGVYQIKAERSGFPTVVRTGIELLVGEQRTVNLELTESAAQEAVSPGAVPIAATTSAVSANIDPRQQVELPVQGRRPQDLLLLAQGMRQVAASEVPQDRQGFFQIYLDGQQVTQLICCSQQQPRYSRDAILEQQVLTNRFDATTGRSQGMVMNAITKSGTNVFAGTLSGYFRDDKFIGEDFVQKRVVPYANQQISGTLGGPIRLDRIHFFGSYEYEREPQTAVFNSVYPRFNMDIPKVRTQHMGLGRADVQFTPNSRLLVRYSKYYQLIPGAGGATVHPSTGQDTRRQSDQYWAVHTLVLGNRAVNSVKGGYSRFNWALLPWVTWNGGGPFGNPDVLGGGTVRIDFSGFSIGSPSNSPQDISEYIWTIRDDFTTSFNKGGRHDVRLGAEYLRWRGTWQGWCNRCNGVLRINARPPANIETLFPVWNDTSTWNLAPLSPLIINYQQSIGNHSMGLDRNLYAFYAHDDWALTPRLTLNLGARYDLDIGVLGEKIKLLPWMSGDRPSDTNNVAPRLGFAFQITDRMVLRGGYGIFYTQLESDAAHQSLLWTKTAIPQVINDGRSDFASNPFNGPRPTYEQVMRNACDQNNNAPGCFRREISIEIPAPSEKDMKSRHGVGYSHMASIGVQRQVGATMAVGVNYVWTGARKEEVNFNMNLAYNPATGANYPFTDRTRLPFPDWGLVLGEFMQGRSDYHGLEMGFTKRFSNRWQAQATYTLSGFWSSIGDPVQVSPDGKGGVKWQPLGFDVAPDLGEDYTLAQDDQRHRATFNGIWDVGYGFQVSGLYFFSSGQRRWTTYGGDRRNVGGGSTARLRPDGTITPRADFVGDPIHRVDVRLRKRFRLAGRATLDGLAEVFNVLNHANYGTYTTAESSALYGRPVYNSNVVFGPRSMQFAFRFAF